MQILGARIGEGMDREIEASPFRRDLLEDAFELSGNGDVARPGDFASELGDERADVGFCFLAQIGDREVGPAARKQRAQP